MEETPKGLVWIKDGNGGRRHLLALEFVPSRHERWFDPEQEAAELAHLAEVDAGNAPEEPASGSQDDEESEGPADPATEPDEAGNRLVRIADGGGGVDQVGGKGKGGRKKGSA